MHSLSKSSTQARLALAVVTGAVLGLTGPGMDMWFIAWFGLAPLLLLTVSAPGIKDALLRGLAFGLAYNLVYQNWYLSLHPLSWMGFDDLQSALVAMAAWLVVCCHQALLVGIICAIIRMLPLSGSFVIRKVAGKWTLPALPVIPLLWVLLQNKIYNAHDYLGVPWPMLEYTQYKILPIIQCGSVIGGIGIGALIVLFNCALAVFFASISHRRDLMALTASSRPMAAKQLGGVAAAIVILAVWGCWRLSLAPNGAPGQLSVIQGNINIEMQKHDHAVSISELVDHYRRMVESVPPGLCVWTESALPTYLKEESDILKTLSQLSRDGKRDMIIGSLDKDFDGKPFNSAFGLASDGTLKSKVYHKRYLVPFGEYMPDWVRFMPEWIRRLTSTPAGVGFNSGKFPVVLDFDGHAVAPLICFETLSPELCASSVRNGGELLVNISDLAWFHKSICGDQMISFSVLRAVETGRYFAFAAGTGPSAIIDPNGRIINRSSQDTESVLTTQIRYSNEITPFVQWFF